VAEGWLKGRFGITGLRLAVDRGGSQGKCLGLGGSKGLSGMESVRSGAEWSEADRRRHFEIAPGSALECAAIQDVLVVGKGLDEKESQRRRIELDRMAAIDAEPVTSEMIKALLEDCP